MPLQKPFRGLSAYSGEYSLGNLKFELGGIVQPALDVSKFLDEYKTDSETIDLDLLSVGNANFFTVPVTECWCLKAMGAITSGVLTGDLGIVPCIIPRLETNKVIPLHHVEVKSSKWAVTNQPVWGFHFGEGVKVQPGDGLGWYVWSITGATRPNLITNILYTKIDL